MHSLVFIVYAGIVAVTSLSPISNQSVEHLDKIVHLLVYYVFAVLGYRMLANKRYFLYMCLAIITYSGLIEFGQSYIPGREMSAVDLLANIVGVALGALVVNRKR